MASRAPALLPCPPICGSIFRDEIPTIFPTRLPTWPANCPAKTDCGVVGHAEAASVVRPVTRRLMMSTGGRGGSDVYVVRKRSSGPTKFRADVELIGGCSHQKIHHGC